MRHNLRPLLECGVLFSPIPWGVELILVNFVYQIPLLFQVLLSLDHNVPSMVAVLSMLTEMYTLQYFEFCFTHES